MNGGHKDRDTGRQPETTLQEILNQIVEAVDESRKPILIERAVLAKKSPKALRDFSNSPLFGPSQESLF